MTRLEEYQTLLRVAVQHRQAVIPYPSLIEAAKKFVADFLCVIDGAFNTNNLQMPILIAVGVLNSGHTLSTPNNLPSSQLSKLRQRPGSCSA